MKTEKIVNYSPEATRAIVEAYQDNPTKEMVAALAQRFGKTTRSIVAKLSREKVYIKPVYKTKTGDTPIAKELIVAEIAKTLSVNAEKLGGLEKANKNCLLLIFARLAMPKA